MFHSGTLKHQKHAHGRRIIHVSCVFQNTATGTGVDGRKVEKLLVSLSMMLQLVSGQFQTGNQLYRD